MRYAQCVWCVGKTAYMYASTSSLRKWRVEVKNMLMYASTSSLRIWRVEVKSMLMDVW